MSQQEEGWPLGLRPLRVGLVRSGSVSFNTLLTASPTSSSDFSSDLDTESSGSFFHTRSITLGSLIGFSNFIELSRRSLRGRAVEITTRDKKNHKFKPWLFSLCSKLSTDAVRRVHNAPSLAHFLEAERRAAATGTARRNQALSVYGTTDLSPILPPASESNNVYIAGQVGSQSSALLGENDEREALDQGIGIVLPPYR